jgi:putative transposase
MTKEWFSAAELAGLPGMPNADRVVRIWADKQSWRSQPRAGRGGGNEYHVSSLPEDTRRYLLRQAVAAVASLPASVPEAAPVVVELTSVDALAGWQRDVMMARLAVCSLVDEFAVHGKMSTRQAIMELLTAAQDGGLTAEQMQTLHAANARQGKHQRRLADRATLYRWMGRRDQGAAALAPKAPPPAPPPSWMAPLLNLYQKVMRKSGVAACIRDWKKHYPDSEPPELRTAQRHISALPREVREWGRRGRNALRAVQPFVRRSTDGLWPMDVVTVDGHLFKAYVKSPVNSAQKMRPEITTYLDVATRRIIGFSCWLAESQVAIWAALRDMVLNPECGIPAIHYSDNGAYRGDIHRAVMERLGCVMSFSQAYRAQSRGMIERLNSSVWVPLAQTFDTYVNDDADAEHTKKALAIANKTGANLLDWPEFLARVRQAIEEYNDRGHGGLPGKISPNQAWANAVAEGWQPTLLEGDGLFDILMQMPRTVDRGEVRLPWGRYFHEALRAYHGQRVAVCIHPTDGSRVGVMDRNERLICVAERDGNVRPYMPDSMVNHGRIQREGAAIKRKERDIANYRLEAQSAYSLPGADVVALRPQIAAVSAEAAEQLDYDAERDQCFNSYMRDTMRTAFADSLDMPQEGGGCE